MTRKGSLGSLVRLGACGGQARKQENRLVGGGKGGVADKTGEYDAGVGGFVRPGVGKEILRGGWCAQSGVSQITRVVTGMRRPATMNR
jgi:hypothetical protein